MKKHTLGTFSIVVLLGISTVGCDDDAATQEMTPADEMAQDALDAREAQDQQIQRDRDELQDMIDNGASSSGPVSNPTTSPTTRPDRDRDSVRRGLLGDD
ncbi:MAG: hypothetical protein AAF656_00145 [Planctomycetota bacterium]